MLALPTAAGLRRMREDEERGIDVTSKAYREEHGWPTVEITRS